LFDSIYLIADLVGVSTPLKNDGVRQLFILFPIYGKIKAQYGKSGKS
jgi:hypothetical protein